MINIEGLDKAKVLKVLYDNAKVLGHGFLDNTGDNIGLGKAEELLSDSYKFDYVHGKMLFIDLSSDIEFDGTKYDKSNGTGKAQSAVDSVRANGISTEYKTEQPNHSFVNWKAIDSDIENIIEEKLWVL